MFTYAPKPAKGQSAWVIRPSTTKQYLPGPSTGHGSLILRQAAPSTATPDHLQSPRFVPSAKLERCFEDKDRLRPGDPDTDAVIRVQQALVDLRGVTGRTYDLGSTGPNHDGVDGKYGRKTGAAVMQFKTDEHLGSTQYADVGPGVMHRLDQLFPGAGPTPPGPTPQPPGPSQPVFICSKALRRAPFGRHAFFRIGGAGSGNSTMELEPEETRTGCFQGVPQRDFREDVDAADADCRATAIATNCLDSAFASYPVGHYCTLGPNSNSFVGHLANQCGAGSIRPSGWLPGYDEAPPPAGTFAPSPESTLLGCSTDCPTAAERQLECMKNQACNIPGGIPSDEDYQNWNEMCRRRTGYEGPDIRPTPRDCGRNEP